MASSPPEWSPSDYAAWWGAILASVTFVWELIKWKADRLRLHADSSTFQVVIQQFNGKPPIQGGCFVNVTISNTGGRRTTIMGVSLHAYHSRLSKILGRLSGPISDVQPKEPNQLPQALDAGDVWVGFVQLDENAKRLASRGLLYCLALNSHGTRQARTKVDVS